MAFGILGLMIQDLGFRNRENQGINMKGITELRLTGIRETGFELNQGLGSEGLAETEVRGEGLGLTVYRAYRVH